MDGKLLSKPEITVRLNCVPDIIKDENSGKVLHK